MLSAADDYPIHQIAEPIRHVGPSDRNFYDRYYFNLHSCSPDLFCVIGLGQYPNLGVSDAFVAIRHRDKHHVIRSSRELGADRMDTAVGPIRVEVKEGLRRLRVVVEPNEWGIALDAEFTGAVVPHLESRHFWREAEHVIFDSRRLAQVGTWTGVLEVDGERFELTSDRWWGSRDRSWGVRPVGEPEPPGIRAAQESPGFFWIYGPMQFQDGAMLAVVQERGDGTRLLEDAQRLAPIDSGREAEPIGHVEHELRFADDGRALTGATLGFYGPKGQQVAEAEVEILLPFALMLGTGYGMEANWRHGMWQGPLVVQGETYDLADPANRPWGFVEHMARFTVGDRVGYGLFEVGIIGTNKQYGFSANDVLGGW